MISTILDHELKAIDIMNNSKMLMKLATMGRDLNVVNAMNSLDYS